MTIQDQFEIFTCVLEITTTQSTTRQVMDAPRIMIERQFISLIYEAAQSENPVKVMLSRVIPIYSQFDQKWLDRECSIAFGNQAFVRVYGEDAV